VGGRDDLEGDRVRQQARLGCQPLGGDAELAEGVLSQALARRERVREPRQRPLQELLGALARARQRRGERDAKEIKRGREREHVEVGHRDDAVLVGKDERVLLGGVQLDLDLSAREGEGVANRAVHLR
jgi:hypothetical protein